MDHTPRKPMIDILIQDLFLLFSCQLIKLDREFVIQKFFEGFQHNRFGIRIIPHFVALSIENFQSSFAIV